MENSNNYCRFTTTSSFFNALGITEFDKLIGDSQDIGHVDKLKILTLHTQN